MPDSTDILAQAIRLHRAGRTAEAIVLARRVSQREPRSVDAANTLGMILFEAGQLEPARYQLERAVGLAPDRFHLHNNLGNIRLAGRDASGAIECYSRAIRLGPPDYFMPQTGISRAYMLAEDLDKAAEHAMIAVRQRPDRIEAINVLAGAFLLSGRVEDLLDTVKDLWGVGGGAGVFTPTPAQRLLIGRMIVLPLNYSDKLTPERIFEQHRELGSLMQDMAPPDPRPLLNAIDPDRPLRVGYVSQDFRNRSAAHFIEPILARHDRERYHAFCYYNNHDSDEMTDRLRALAFAWRSVVDLDDRALAERIREDAIDVLVDLTGHTGGNRVQALCYRPAPVQCTYMGYANTTGIPSCHYRFVDALTDPPGAERLATEELIRLDGCFLCYAPPPHAPDVAPPPHHADGHVTFGSFNTQAKVSDAVWDAWAAILARAPGSRLFLKNLSLGDESVRARARESLTRRGVDPARVEMRGETRGKDEHMGTYARVDVALDTFPYNGTTTTVEALWMGVPVVAVAGKSHVSRVGVSLLTHLGLEDLVAPTREAYIELAVRLAGDPARRADLRRTLRERVRSSRLCDAPAFVGRLENVYRALWRRWCESVTESL
ncbi:MAG: tetratricopeptide repeat protein [Phycisphaerae bacterium]|nr:tetratricopeptide repeat protein [Phycisphaerae bacterium]